MGGNRYTILRSPLLEQTIMFRFLIGLWVLALCHRLIGYKPLE